MNDRKIPQRRRKPRLQDIAEASGVSTATVSRVLNGKPGVGDDVRDQVAAAVDRLGYERPAALKHRTTGLVGVIVPELNNPIFAEFAHQLAHRLGQRGFTPLLYTQAPGGVTEGDAVEAMMGQGVSGIIFVSGLHADTTAPRDHYHDLRRRGVPLVFVNGYAEGVEGTFLAPDDAEAIDGTVRHLVSLGHQQIGLVVGPERLMPAQRKIAAFKASFVAQLGATEDDAESYIFRTLYTMEGGYAAAERLIDRGATALICASDLMALGAIRAVRGRGLRVPEDVSVVGYDDGPLMAFVDPPLTTVHEPVTALCQAAVSALESGIYGAAGPGTELLFRAELIVRASTSTVPGRSLS